MQRIRCTGDEAQQRQMVQQWNDTHRPYPHDRCVHVLFEEQAERTPEALALVHEGRQLSYRELNQRAEQLACYLRGQGVCAQDRVALVLPRSIELVVGQLAILKCKAVYVPLDASAPAERLAYLIEDCDARRVLSLRSCVLPERCASARIDLDALALDEQSLAEPLISGVQQQRAGWSSESVAYVMYTSGSSGEPKGVLITHRGIARLVLQSGYMRFAPSDRMALAGNPAFDITTLEVWGPLLHGAAVVIVEQEKLLDAAALVQLVREQRINVLHLVPGLLGLHMHALKTVFASLKYLLTGGDVVEARVLSEVLQGDAPEHVIHCYGPTESTTFALTHEVQQLEAEQSVPLGRPIANTRVYILDRQGEPVPIGVSGEICIAGAGLAHGYWNAPALSAERFIPDEFAGEPGARLYRSGDQGRRLPDGTVQFLGRADEQVKIRGHRVELAEVQAALLSHAAVKQAAVLAREDQTGQKRLIAYYTLAPEASGSIEASNAESLRAHLVARLPDYMLPAAFVPLESWPLTANGKLDRRALAARHVPIMVSRGYEQPVGEVEHTLAHLWSELLQVERVGRSDHFFELGGHSLLITQLILRIDAALSVKLTVSAVFENPTLSALAQAIGDAKLAPAVDLPIERADRHARLPLSFAQQRLWFLSQIGAVSQAYHVALGVRLRGRLDQAALRRALDRIVARHEALRTTFVQVEGELTQRIADEDCGFALQEQDLSSHPEIEVELRRLVTEEAATQFDLATGPLIRGRLIRLAAQEHALLLTLHHIVSDAWSLDVLFNELSVLYRAYRLGQTDPLRTLAIQYADYAAWQRRGLAEERLQAQSGYWRNALRGAPALLELPTDRARPAQQDFSGSHISVELDQRLTASLRELSKRHGTTLFMTVLAGWAVVLSRLSGQRDLVIGTPVVNRMRAELKDLVGFFVNTLAMRLTLSGRPAVCDLLRQVKTQAIGAQEHQELPFEQVVEIVRPPRSLAHTPVFQVMLNWQNSTGRPFELPELALAPLDVPHATTKFDLTLNLIEVEDQVVGSLEFATALFDRATIERHVTYLRQALEAMAANEQLCIERLPLMSEAERRLVLTQWNETKQEQRANECIHVPFEAQVRRTPEAIALVHEEGQLTYHELNASANQLAAYLRKLGVGPDSRVALCVGRSPELLIGLLAILKAGGAYVPLDPGYPPERLSYMLRDCAPVALLTHSRLPASVQSSLREAVISDGVPLLDLQADVRLWESEPKNNLECNAIGLTPEHLAYVIYTSGSTGTPKAAQVLHTGLASLLSWYIEDIRLAREDAVLLVTSHSFDLTQKNILGPLRVGGTLSLAPDRFDPPRILDQIERERITLLNCAPSAFHALIEADVRGQLAGVRRVVLGGEPIQVSKLLMLREPRPQIINSYGPTECSDVVAYHVLSGDLETYRQQGVPLGRPIRHTRLYVLGADGEPVPIGVSGEICVGGAGVGRGYLNRPGMTAERFIPDPFASEDGARMYCTGDLGRYRRNGDIEYLGRNDFQVKVRGMRVELGEIEARLAQHPLVREAVVLAREDGSGDRFLVAYYTCDEAPERDALRKHLLAALPAYMVPAVYVRLESFPLNPNGKLDRKALPAFQDERSPSSARTAPESRTELTLTAVWKEILRVQDIGVHDNFFEAGGHSLLGVRMIAMLKPQGFEITSVDIFNHPTIRALASHIDARAPAALPGGAVGIRTTGAQPPLFLVHDYYGLDLHFPALAARIDPDVPVYGLTAAALGERQLETMEGLAARLVRVVREIQPRGPYRLAGWSSAGALAYEIAHQLIGEDQVVSLLGLIDSYAPRLLRASLVQQRLRNDTPAKLLLSLCEGAARPGTEHAQNAALIRASAAAMDLTQMLSQCTLLGLLPQYLQDRGPREIQQYLERLQAHCTALENYAAPPVTAPLHVFVAQDRSMQIVNADPWLGWRSVVPQSQIALVEIPGTHFTIMEDPHIADLGRSLSEALRTSPSESEPPEYKARLTIQSGRASRTPIVCIPGAGDSVVRFNALVAALGEGWPIHGMQPRGVNGLLVPHSNVEAAASAYLREVDAFARGRPVHLLGHSFGGWVAFEMAQRLAAAGTTVASLTLIDSDAPDSADKPLREYTPLQVLWEYIGLVELGAERSLNLTLDELTPLDEERRIRMLHDRMVATAILPPRSSIEALEGPLRTFGAALRTRYCVSRSLERPVSLVMVPDSRRTEAANREQQEQDFAAWKKLAPEICRWHGPGNHMTIMKPPHVDALAQWWLDRL